jgi:AAA+ ATPase superfamily predicted ATPase
MITTRKINNNKVIPPVLNQGLDDKPILGSTYLPEPYGNVCILGRKNSGKSSCIYTLLKNCTGKGTTVFIISPTVHKDKTYAEIIKMLEKKSVTVVLFDDLEVDGEDLLKSIMEEMRNDNDESYNEVEPKKIVNLLFPSEERKVERKKRASKYLFPKYQIVLDDLGIGLRSKSLSQLMKVNRHYLSRIYIVSHHIKDVLSRSQIDTCIVYNGFSDQDKLYELYTDLNVSIPLNHY